MKEINEIKDICRLQLGTLIYNSIVKKCNAIERRLKALDIIIEKDVSCKMVELCKTTKDYNHFLEEQDYIYCHLEKDEFELLKEILE